MHSAALSRDRIVVVDDDVDITDPAEVMWAVATRWDPKTQTDIIDGCWTGYIDPMLLPERREKGDMTNSRAIIYAVRPYHWKEQFPKVNTVSREYAAEVEKSGAERPLPGRLTPGHGERAMANWIEQAGSDPLGSD